MLEIAKNIYICYFTGKEKMLEKILFRYYEQPNIFPFVNIIHLLNLLNQLRLKVNKTDPG